MLCSKFSGVNSLETLSNLASCLLHQGRNMLVSGLGALHGTVRLVMARTAFIRSWARHEGQFFTTSDLKKNSTVLKICISFHNLY